jgi:hypothetical protein
MFRDASGARKAPPRHGARTAALKSGSGESADALNATRCCDVRAPLSGKRRRRASWRCGWGRRAGGERSARRIRAIDRNIGAMQNNTGREMLRQRNEMLNYVSLRTASQRPQ